MLAISTLNSEQHRHQVFESSPILLGNGPQASEDMMSVQDNLLGATQCKIHWSRNAGSLQVHLENQGSSIALDIGPRIHSGVSVELKLPSVFWVGDTTIQLSDPQFRPEYDQCLTKKPISHINSMDVTSLQQSPAPATLASWFDALGKLQVSPAGSKEYFEQAARLCFCPGGLDGAMILLPKQSGWEIAASHICYPEQGFGYRFDLIERAVQDQAVVFHDAQKMDSQEFKQEGHSVIVCPIFDPQKKCSAVLYGFRSLNRRNFRQGIRHLEACFVELTARSISAAMARLESDAEAAKTRVLLEQAFSPQVARKLQQNPRILEGQTREVSVLFCDLRGFTNISERVGAKITYEFLTDVMDRFCQLIRDHDGVIIDFYGDGLSAFWNAPVSIPNHAESACRCALAIEKSIKAIELKWQSRLLHEIRIGIGVHTGLAQVGNSGSRTRLKYGPRGNTVNLASRLECATKQTGAQILVSKETLQRLPDNFIARRVCNAQLPGMNQTSELHELMGDSVTKQISKLTEQYEVALDHYERRKFLDCQGLLSEILLTHEHDRVSEFLFTACQEQSRPGHEPENLESTKTRISPLIHDLIEVRESEPANAKIQTKKSQKSDHQ